MTEYYMEMEVNILLICVAGFAIINTVRGYQRGMVKAIISLVSLIVLCVVATLLAYGIGSYYQGNFFHVVLVVFLLTVLGIVHHLLDVVFFSAKMIAKLPVIHSADKILGIVFGLVETVLILWTVYIFAGMMNLGSIGEYILACTERSLFLSWLYRHNYLYNGITFLLKDLVL